MTFPYTQQLGLKTDSAVTRGCDFSSLLLLHLLYFHVGCRCDRFNSSAQERVRSSSCCCGVVCSAGS